jgi:hypothetical protein
MSRIPPIGLRIASNTQNFEFIGTSPYDYFNQLKQNLNVAQAIARVNNQLICPTLADNTRTKAGSKTRGSVLQSSLLPLTNLLNGSKLIRVQLMHARFFFCRKKVPFGSARLLFNTSLHQYISNPNSNINPYVNSFSLIDRLCLKPLNKTPFISMQGRHTPPYSSVKLNKSYNGLNAYGLKFVKTHVKRKITLNQPQLFVNNRQLCSKLKSRIRTKAQLSQNESSQRFIINAALGLSRSPKLTRRVTWTLKDLQTKQKASSKKFLKHRVAKITQKTPSDITKTRGHSINALNYLQTQFSDIAFRGKDSKREPRNREVNQKFKATALFAVASKNQFQPTVSKVSVVQVKKSLPSYQTVNTLHTHNPNLLFWACLQRLISTKVSRDLKKLPLYSSLTSNLSKNRRTKTKDYDIGNLRWVANSYTRFSNFLSTFDKTVKLDRITAKRQQQSVDPTVDQVNQHLAVAAKQSLSNDQMIISLNAKTFINQTFNAPQGLHNFYLIPHRLEKSRFNLQQSNLYSRYQHLGLNTRSLALTSKFQNIITFELLDTDNNQNSISGSVATMDHTPLQANSNDWLVPSNKRKLVSIRF